MKKLLMFLTLSAVPFAALADNAADYYTIGLHDYQQGQIDQAIPYLQGAIQADPSYWQAYQVLGYCYYQQKDNVQALQAMDKSLQLHPDNAALRQFDDQVRAATPNAPPASTSMTPSSSMPALPAQAAPAAQADAPASSGLDPNLPKQGKIIFDLVDSDWIAGWQDLDDLYGTTISSTSTPVGVKLGLGADYVVSPNFQIGARLQVMVKQPEEVSDGYYTDTWSENAIGGAAAFTGTFPMGDGINFIASAEGGFYALVGSTLSSNAFSGNINLDGSGPGGMATVGVELLMDAKKSWALDLGIDYQFLSISPVTESYNGSSATLHNNDGSNGTLDFSGAGIFLAARFF